MLGAILTVALTLESPWQGGGLLAAYALGEAVPLLLLAGLWDRYDLGTRRWLRGRTLTLGRLRVHTVSLVSSLLFIVIGVIFLRYDGTAGLTGSLGVGDLTDVEFSAQQAVTEWTSGVPGWAVLLLVTLVASYLAWRRAQRRTRLRRHPGPTTELRTKWRVGDWRSSRPSQATQARDAMGGGMPSRRGVCRHLHRLSDSPRETSARDSRPAPPGPTSPRPGAAPTAECATSPTLFR